MTKERAESKRTFTGPIFGLLALLVADAALGPAGGSNAMEKGMEIRILIEGTALAATLEDNAASRDFVAQLPLDLTLEDYNAIPKNQDPGRFFSTLLGDPIPRGPVMTLVVASTMLQRQSTRSRGLLNRFRASDSQSKAARQPPCSAS